MGKLLLIMTLILLSMTSHADAGVPTEVVLNRSILLSLNKPVSRVTLANPAVADIMAISPKQIQIIGLSIGQTTLIIWEEGAKQPVFYDLKVRGDQASIEDQLKEIAPNVSVQYVNDTVILSGKVDKEQQKAKVEKITQAYVGKIINNIEIAEPKQVLLEVKVAQVDKTSLKKLGISFLFKGNTAEGFTNMVGAPSGGTTSSTLTSSLGGTSATVGSGTGISANVPGLGSYTPLDGVQMGASLFKAGVGTVLQALATQGYAKVLAEPNLLVKSGQEGNFLAGSKIPFSVVSSTGGLAATEIKYETVGVKLKFKPEVLENGLINLKLDPAEVSSVAGTMAVNGYPIIDTREVRTNVELRDGESLVLAGLLQEEAIRTMSKIPLLGDIPILGALFRSTQDDMKEKELVFFITPKIVNPIAAGTKTELPTDRKLTSQEEDALKWMPLGF